jgi:hypothetical protein
MRLAFLWNWNAVDLSASDNAAGDWKLRAGAHQVGIDLASTLTAFVDAPGIVLVLTSDK